MKVIELKVSESKLCKELRLLALKDAPLAFGETLEQALEHDDKYWDLITESMVPPNKQRMFIAKDDGHYIGSVYALEDKNDKTVGRLAGMWVDSKSRKKGVGKMLVESHQQWAKSLGFKKIRLWVEDPNKIAKEFYARLGFYETGTISHTEKKLHEMQFDL